MPSDLSSARRKIERANKHIADLSLKVADFLGGNPYHAVPKYHVKEDITAFVLDRWEDVPEPIPEIIGDALHNLRSALDHLANTLVERGVQSEIKRPDKPRTYFPICESSKKYEAEAPRKVEGMRQPDIDAIALLKPYLGGTDILWGLHTLDIIDKHRMIVTTGSAVESISFVLNAGYLSRHSKGRINLPQSLISPRRVSQSPKTRIVAGNKGDIVAGRIGDYERNEHVELTFTVTFDEPEIFEGRPVMETLKQLADLVSGIVDSFELPQ